MKKYILVCSFVLSAFTFASSHDSHQTHSQQNMMNNMPMMQQSQNANCPTCNNNMMQNMTQMPGWKADKKMMRNNMMMYATPEMQKNMIDIEQKELDIKKAMLEDKVDWNKVDKLNKEIGEIRAKMQTEMMKKNYEMMKNPPVTDTAKQQ